MAIKAVNKLIILNLINSITTNKKSGKFSEDAFFDAYKIIRNNYRKYTASSIIECSLEYLGTPTKSNYDVVSKYPWLVFLLLKWVLIDSGIHSPGKKQITNNAFYSLLNQMHDLSGNTTARMPSEYAHFRLFLRNTAYQQFFYQEQFNIAAFARQSIFFDNLKNDHPFKISFKKITGFEIAEFLDLSMMLLANVVNRNSAPISTSWFSSVKKYNLTQIESFLYLISRDSDSLRESISAEFQTKPRKASELFEETYLIKFPLLILNNQYCVWHPVLLYRRIEYFIYDTLRSGDVNTFMNKFGAIFESYVHSSIYYLGKPFLTEKELKNKLETNGKVTDFLIAEDNANIFIDAKGVELPYLGKVSHDPNVIQDKTSSSAIKGIEQGFEIIKTFSKFGKINDTFKPAAENYLLIITMKEFYIGNGNDFYESIAKKKIDEFIGMNNTLPIPLENIYFLTIDDFDCLVSHSKNQTISLINFLRGCVEKDKDPRTKKFHFKQHLLELKLPNTRPEFIEKKINTVWENIKNALTES